MLKTNKQNAYFAQRGFGRGWSFLVFCLNEKEEASGSAWANRREPGARTSPRSPNKAEIFMALGMGRGAGDLPC